MQYGNEYGTQNFIRYTSPVDGIIVGIFAECLIKVGHFGLGLFLIVRMIGVDIDSQNVFAFLFPLQVFQKDVFPRIVETGT